jgi:hypothetical protein
MNGVTYSNTKFFEDVLNFNGVLIEPTVQFNELILNRSKCACYNYAINYNNEPVKFIGNYATAGLVNTMHPNFRNVWHKDNSNEYYVNGIPICALLKHSGIKYIDLITIDVEGGEQVVLETMDFNIPIYLIVIELDGHNDEKDNKCREILKQNGFEFKSRIAINEYWINDNYFRKNELYDANIQKLNFEKLNELGNFPFLAPHLIETVENSLK